jgi:hypothetical protein
MRDDLLRTKRQARRRSWMDQALGDPRGWSCDGELRDYPGGRVCACGRLCYHAFTLVRADGDARGLKVYLGARCAVTALAYVTGGLLREEKCYEES